VEASPSPTGSEYTYCDLVTIGREKYPKAATAVTRSLMTLQRAETQIAENQICWDSLLVCFGWQIIGTVQVWYIPLLSLNIINVPAQTAEQKAVVKWRHVGGCRCCSSMKHNI
jgi:hypothetical protein